MPYLHIPVLLEQIISSLKLRLGSRIIDCTLGGGGHAEAILKKIGKNGKYVGIDLDDKAHKAAKKRLAKYSNQMILVKDNFKNLDAIAEKLKFKNIDAILIDLGLSSGQLQDKDRGFSFFSEGKLDMRFGLQLEKTAGDIVNYYSQKDLQEIFKNYGEERLAGPIAKNIVEVRKKEPILSANQLADIAGRIYERFYKKRSKINPATKIFQALRIVTNDEIQNLRQALPKAISLLAPEGRLAIISYHSLEDRIVKIFFTQESRDCICPIEIPICTCCHKKSLKIITKKPILPSREEIDSNHRARSAKLRVAEKL